VRNFLFSIDTKAPDFASDDADAFHMLVAKLLLLSMQARPNVLTADSRDIPVHQGIMPHNTRQSRTVSSYTVPSELA
jgi:hypothetical protein